MGRAKLYMRIIAALQIVGGVVGILRTGWVVFPVTWLVLRGDEAKLWDDELGFWVGALVIILLIAAAMFTFCVAAGCLLWRGQRRGLTWSMITQALQVPVFISPVLSYKFVSPLSAFVAFDAGSLHIGYEIKSVMELDGGSPGGPIFCGVNVVAMVLFLYLYKHHRRIRDA